MAQDPVILINNSSHVNSESQLLFGYNSGSETYAPVSISYLNTSASGKGKGDLRFSTRDATTDSVPTERMRITSSGNVGIGTSPSTLLHLVSAQPELKIQSNGSSQTATISMTGSDGADAIINSTHSSGKLKLQTNSSDKLTIDSSGNVGIGTASPNRKFEVQSDGGQVRISDTDGSYGEIFTNAGDYNFRATGNGGTGTIDGFMTFDVTNSGTTSEAMRIDSSGNVGINTNSPTSVLTVKSDTTNDLANGIRLEANGSTNTPVLMYENNTAEGVIELFDGSTKTVRLMADGTSYFGRGKISIGATKPSETPITYASALLNLHEPVAAPGIGTIADSQIHLYNGTLIGDHSTLSFGYNVSGVTNTTAYISYVSTNQGAYGFGDLIFGTRDVNSDTAPSERLRILSDGNFIPGTDGLKNFGNVSKRFNAFFASTGTIQTSDKQDKEDILLSSLGLNFINKLKPSSYKMKQNESGRTHYGLIAQDIENILSEFNIKLDDFAPVTKTKIEEDGNERYRYGLRYQEFLAPIIKAIQELSAKVNALEGS